MRDDPNRQIAGMGRAFPGFHWRRTRFGMTWTGQLAPTIDSPAYRIRITHNAGRAPRVSVLSPRIDPAAMHLYRDGSLCLYWPEEWSWSSQRSLAKSIVPWAALWLYYYEIWCLVGEWLGPSSPHGNTRARKEVAIP